jgi:hypothetical protein
MAASEERNFKDSFLETNLNDSISGRCPFPTVPNIGSCRSPGMRRMGKPTFVMPSINFHLNFGGAATAVVGGAEMMWLRTAANRRVILTLQPVRYDSGGAQDPATGHRIPQKSLS